MGAPPRRASRDCAACASAGAQSMCGSSGSSAGSRLNRRATEYTAAGGGGRAGQAKQLGGQQAAPPARHSACVPRADWRGRQQVQQRSSQRRTRPEGAQVGQGPLAVAQERGALRRLQTRWREPRTAGALLCLGRGLERPGLACCAGATQHWPPLPIPGRWLPSACPPAHLRDRCKGKGQQGAKGHCAGQVGAHPRRAAGRRGKPAAGAG